jgi:hypothetical protein
MLSRINGVAAVAAVLTLAACAKPVPQDRADYVGEWRGQAMALLITGDGSVAYKRLKGGVTTKITGPIRGFEGDSFVVGIPLFSTTFEVSRPPHEEGGKWKMVVDGVELTRVSPGAGPAPRRTTPAPGSSRI